VQREELRGFSIYNFAIFCATVNSSLETTSFQLQPTASSSQQQQQQAEVEFLMRLFRIHLVSYLFMAGQWLK